MNAEQDRLAENREDKRWHLWGPYLAERAWGTVREDYSANGDAWNYFPHDQARSRAFRWGEDGIGGISDYKQRLCLAFAFWNGRDPFLKERLFGVTGPQGSHGEDVKEVYFYTDSTPTHSYMRMLYRYPQARFPYEELVAANHGRPKHEPEFELWDTGILRDHRYFDISLEYAKVDPDDFFIRVTATNRGPEAAPLHILPTLWFRNTWSWGRDDHRPSLRASSDLAGHCPTIQATHRALGDYKLHCEDARDLLFTENETNTERLFSSPNKHRFVKDGINDFIGHGRTGTVNPERVGTKAAAHYQFTIEPGASKVMRLWFGRVGEAVEDDDRSGEPRRVAVPVGLPVPD
ncbi:MAG TPA: hypothetical protein VK581_12575, partial [Chthoniobacterales bacterium]|nr:hypothetical protein [Chthoniobacterales bacterium]